MRNPPCNKPKSKLKFSIRATENYLASEINNDDGKQHRSNIREKRIRGEVRMTERTEEKIYMGEGISWLLGN